MKTLIALLLMTTTVLAAEDSALVKETLTDFDKQLARKDSYWTPMKPDNMPVGGLESVWKNGATQIYGVAPVAPTEKQKTDTLRKAFEERNEKYKAEAREAARKAFGADDARPVKTEKVIPVAAPEEKNYIDNQADINWEARRKFMHRTFLATQVDICQEHHMHKVVMRGGKSWRCR